MLEPEILFGLIMGYMIAWVFEKYYINTYSVLPNVAGIFFIIQPFWIVLPQLMKYWMYLGIFLGIVALYFLLNKNSLPNYIYDITYPLYSGKTIMGIYAPLVLFKEVLTESLWLANFWVVVVVWIIANWYIGVKYFNNNKPFKKL